MSSQPSVHTHSVHTYSAARTNGDGANDMGQTADISEKLNTFVLYIVYIKKKSKQKTDSL